MKDHFSHPAEEALNRYIKATNTHRFSEVEKRLHPGAVYYFSDRTCSSIEEIQTYFEHAWAVVKEEVYGAIDVNWLQLGEQQALCVYRFTYEGYVDGEFVKGHGRATNAFVKEEGRWLLIHEHLSGEPE
ncbi:cag pathogenicity island protein Cag4 [Rossellomorea marisflavi]|uniref:Cag pathogenicity island protein Cag4 n=1 Tax=Rossellomorea marisflavi TaxID=189381 RepID=A0A0M0G562_9BACI|nr:nuclear transport factor 2 family protein [Rossellomorea marisflavi]KON84672.1 cag pathogenicity island protein Cag4 [Rossellomorea marisflavi]